MPRIDINHLTEQLNFLFTTQSEARNSIDSIYADFLTAIDKKIKDLKASGKDVEKLSSIRALVKERTQELSDEMKEDIAFLAEQKEYLKQLQAMEDKTLAAQLLDDATQDIEKLHDTALFKKEIAADFEESKKELLSVVGDLKAALEEGNLEEIEAAFQDAIEDDEDDEDFDEEDEEECGGCEDSCRHSCGCEDKKKKR